MGRRDDHVRESVARDVRHRHHPVAEEPVRPLAVPLADQVAVRTRPHRGGPVLLVPVPELEAGSGGDVRVAVAVDVERLAEAEPELTAADAPGEAPRQAPAGSRSGAGRRGTRRSRGRDAGDREAAENEGGGSCRESASPARACRRRQRRSLTAADPAACPAMLHCTLSCERPEGTGGVVERDLVTPGPGVRRRRTPS